MDKKLIILIAVVVVVIGGIVVLTQSGLISMSNAWLDGESEAAIRGDLVIPVTATGTVQAARLTQIKSKASGQVEEIPVVEGQMVQAGDILVRLDPVDEKRNVEARQANLDRAKSVLEKARITLEDRKIDLPLLTDSAQSRYDDAVGRFEEAEYIYQRTQGLMENNAANKTELIHTKTSFQTAKSAKELARVELERAKKNESIQLRSAKEDVAQADAAHREAVKQLDEAKQRLKETTVRAPSDGMVYSIATRKGEMIQSGTSTFTGGTALMFLADVSSMFVIAQIDEADIGAIRKIAPDYARPGQTQKLDESVYVENAQSILDAADREEAAESDEEAAAREKALEETLANEGFEIKGRPVEVTVEAYRAETYRGVIERILPEPIRTNNAIAFMVRIRLIGD
ncbi:MAG: HlyD family secretion protein, partial [Phycisphaerae bacterium]